jgi:hypothetical protein
MVSSMEHSAKVSYVLESCKTILGNVKRLVMTEYLSFLF